MEDLPTINRHAVVALPTEAFVDWLKASPVGEPDYTLATVRREPTIFLIGQEHENAERVFRDHWRPIAEELFGGWCTDPGTWPKNLSAKTLGQYVVLKFASMLCDLIDRPIRRDD